MRLRTTFLATALALALPATAAAATYQVGPGRTYANLGAVANLVSPGDVVLVDGGSTYPAARFTRAGTSAAKITIRGVRSAAGARPVISGGTNSIEAAGDHYVFEGLDVTGGSSRCFFHHADDVTLRDSVIHDCPAQGVLGADNDSGSMLMEYVEVHHCGAGTQNHQIYMATDEVSHPGSVFRMQHCYVHDGNGGNNVKSRAERNEIYFNWIEGALYHELELIGPDPGGAAAGWTEALKREDSDVVGNVLRKTNTSFVTRIGGDGTGASSGRYRFVGNTIVLAPATTSSAVFRCFDAIESVEMHDNAIFRDGGGAVDVLRAAAGEVSWSSGSPQIAGSRNFVVTGATTVPASWTGTVFAPSPGVVSTATFDLRPAAGSPLIDAATTNTTASAPGHAFPSPLLLPTYLPPKRALQALGTASPRPSSGAALDIGAYEYVAPGADAGVVDAGGDTGAGVDSGTGVDSGVVVDSGVTSDSAGGSDSATGEDAASAPDSSAAADAAPADDAALDDSGVPAGGAGGSDGGACGCRAPRVAGDAPGLLALLGISVAIGRSRARK